MYFRVPSKTFVYTVQYVSCTQDTRFCVPYTDPQCRCYVVIKLVLVFNNHELAISDSQKIISKVLVLTFLYLKQELSLSQLNRQTKSNTSIKLNLNYNKCIICSWQLHTTKQVNRRKRQRHGLALIFYGNRHQLIKLSYTYRRSVTFKTG